MISAEIRTKAQFYDLDPMQIVWHGNYARFFEQARCALLDKIDFNYDVEPLPGSYPLPAIGPLRLLEETRTNHLGKKAFEWVYWHVLLPGHPIPLPADLSLAGKHAVPAGSAPSERAGGPS